MKTFKLLVAPLLVLPFVIGCNNGGGDKPEEVKFSLSGNPTITGKVATVNIDWTPTDTIKFESFTFTTTTSKENTVTFDQTGDPRPMPVTITFKDDVTEDISGTLKFSYEDVTAKSKGESSLTFTISKPEPVEYSVINKLTVKDDETDRYKVTFDYFPDNQYVENESIDNIGVYRKIYHIIEKTGDGGYIDYSIVAYPSEENGDFKLNVEANCDTYDANGKIIKHDGLVKAEAVESTYPGYDIQLSWIELKFADFELTKFYYFGSLESSYNDNSALLKSVTKNFYKDDHNKVISLVTTSVTEDVYDNEGRLVKDYMFSAYGESTVKRVDYTYDTNGLLTDDAGHVLSPKGEDEEFSTFIQTFDVNESSFEDYAQDPGFTEQAYIEANAYMYKATSAPNIFEIEYFMDEAGENKYLLANYLGDYGAYYKTTYGENGSYKDEIYAYTLSIPEPTEGQTRDNLQFLDLTPGELKRTYEVVYDDYQNRIKGISTTINEGVTVVDAYSFEYRIDEGKITQYDNYYVEGKAASTVVEYTTNDNDYGQTFGWVYNNIKNHTLV